MIFVAKNADFSAKNIGNVSIDYSDSDWDGQSGSGGDSSSTTTKVSMISINEDISSLKVSKTHTFTAEVFPSNATDKTILWSCSPTTYTSIDAHTGELTAIKAGNVTIKAKAVDGSNTIATYSLEVLAKTKDDISNTALSVLNYYGTHHTDEQAVAVDDMITALGGSESGSIWSKLKVVHLPCLANNINNAFINAKNGADHMNYTSSGKINASTNSIEWNCYTLSAGNVVCVDTSNTKNTLNVPIYQANIKLSECSLIFGGKAEFAGGTGCVLPVTDSTKLYTNSTSTRRIGADYSVACLKGWSISYTNGYDATGIYPTDKIVTRYGSSEILNTIKEGYNTSNTEFHWNTYLRCYNQYYCFVLGEYLTPAELNTAGQAIDTLLLVFNVDQSI